MAVSLKAIRWVARVSGLLFGGGFVLILLATAIDSLMVGAMEPPGMNAVVQLTVTLTGIMGLLLAWRWELAGGILAVVAFAALGFINPATIPIPLIGFLIPSILFLIAGWLDTTPSSKASL